jgi:putative inorganic carbon (HCO3(-)) transporter
MHMTALPQLFEPVRWSNRLVSPPVGGDAVRAPAFGFFLFILANAALYVRPADLLKQEDLPIYLILMVASLLVSYRSVLQQLSLSSLEARPITVMLLGLLVAVVLSHLSHLRLDDAWTSGFAFFKLVLYYLLLVAVIDSPRRLHDFLAWLIAFIVVVVLLGLLQYNGWIYIPELPIQPFSQRTDTPTGPEYLLRLTSVGVFNNPNDLARILLITMPLSLYGLVHGRTILARCLAGFALIAFGYAFILTYSRGGLLGLVAALGAIFISRFGLKKSFLLLALSLPAVFFLFQGRQTDLSAIEDGTGQSRIQLWSDGLQLLRSAPFFGIGYDEYASAVGLVAHNSYVQCYVELGIFGGSCFLAAFYLPLNAWARLSRRHQQFLDPNLRRLRPYLIAIFAGYGVSLYSSTRSYLEQTYLVFGLATIYFCLARSTLVANSVVRPSGVRQAVGVSAIDFAMRCNRRLLWQVLAVGTAGLIALDLFVRVFANYGWRDT